MSGSLKSRDVVVEVAPKYFRPAKVDYLLADISNARERLGWTPKVLFNELVKVMVDADHEHLGIKPPGEGKRILSANDIHWTTNRITIK